MNNDKIIISNERELGKFFERERKKSITFLTRQYSLSKNDAEDVYQESCISLFENIRDGKLVDLTSTLSTYFTRICMNLSLKYIRDKEKITDNVDDAPFDAEKIDELLGFSQEGLTEEQIESMHNIVSQLPSPCEEILWSYYADNRSMEEIAVLVDYKNADTVKVKKSQCMNKLKAKFDNDTKNEFYE